MSKSKKPVSALDLFPKSYEIVVRNLKNFAILFALPAIASIFASAKYQIHNSSGRWSHINFFSGTTPAYGIVLIASSGLIIFLILAVLALLIQAMLTVLEVEGAKNKTPSFQHLWDLGKNYWLRLFGLTLVIGMYIIGASLIGVLVLIIFRDIIGALIGFGLIVAALLFVLTHYYLAPYAMVDKDLSIFEAMEESANLSKKNVGAVLSVIGVSILLGFTGIVPILGPLISFVLGAIYSVAPALRYYELKKLR